MLELLPAPSFSQGGGLRRTEGAEGHDPATAGKKGMPEGKTWREAGPCPEVGRERSGMSAGKRLTFAGAASRP